ncbi:MAG: RNA polymerase factor sigma-54 [Bacteroides sp.]|nr:RNA polymerase factor sigma-54 [Bacteroides sp.]MCM1379183.1 RNA polymerase factor sigma-54 [Bacteroides sp.]MCM1445168.1 RNA polymerase factor sigma-54 [Prevotella sp.]
MNTKFKITQQQQLRQRLLPQQLRLVSLVEKTNEEVEEEIARELAENPALEKVADRYPTAPSSQTGPTSPTDYARESEQTLAEYLLDQLGDLEPQQRELVRYMIGALDANGYLTRTLPQLISDITLSTLPLRHSATEAEIRRAYATLRSLDPAGVGAQDLRDCLVLQLGRVAEWKSGKVNTPPLCHSATPLSDALEIVKYFFDVYSTRNLRKLSDISEIPLDRVRAADELIKTLNPKPGAAFAADSTREMASSAVSPDFIVETDGRRLSVSMPNSLPELRIEESFLADNGPGEVAEFIRDRRIQAQSFIEVLHRRQQTLMAIAKAIVNIQSPFFLNFDDESRIRPMVLRQIADATGLDISLISRAISGKWLATAHGVYSLKSFFNHRSGAEDTETSAQEIAVVLRDIIADEPTEEPLSDEAIAAELKRRGYNVARRTVAKYRTRLNIPSARLRRH